MNLNRHIRYLLLTLFALLQGLAPVAHAHVYGDNAGHSNIHLAFAEELHFKNAGSGAKQLTAESDHSSVVSMPAQFKSNDLKVVQHVNVVESRPEILCELIVLHLSAQSRLTGFNFPYQHPCSQAPPL